MNQEEMKQRTKLFALGVIQLVESLPKERTQKCLVDNCCDQGPQLDQTIGVVVEPSLLQTSFLKWVLLKRKWMNHCIGWSY